MSSQLQATRRSGGRGCAEISLLRTSGTDEGTLQPLNGAVLGDTTTTEPLPQHCPAGAASGLLPFHRALLRSQTGDGQHLGAAVWSLPVGASAIAASNRRALCRITES